MRNLAMTLSAAVVWVLAALPVRADTQQSSAAAVHRPNATMLAKRYKCGGEELQCEGNLAKVCNMRNGRCCCLTVGTDH